MQVEALHNLIHDHEVEFGDYDAVYVPASDWDDLRDGLEAYGRVDESPTFGGYQLVRDPLISEAQVLPSDVDNLLPDDLYLNDPPVGLLSQLIDIETRAYEDPIRDLSGETFRTTFYMEVVRERQEFDPDMVARYGDPISTRNLRVINDRDCEYDTEPDETRREKAGRNHVTTGETPLSDMAGDMVRDFAEAIHRTIGSVRETPVVVERKRGIRFPWPALDFTHRERLYFGTKYTHFGDVCMVPPSRINAAKIDRKALC